MTDNTERKELVQRLRDLRDKAIANGIKLIDIDEINRLVDSGRQSALAALTAQQEPGHREELWKEFDITYQKACRSSQPTDWMNAALLAQQVRAALTAQESEGDAQRRAYAGGYSASVDRDRAAGIYRDTAPIDNPLAAHPSAGEPVAWMQTVENPGEPKRFLLSMECENSLHRQIKQGGTYQRIPLYTAPQPGVRDRLAITRAAEQINAEGQHSTDVIAAAPSKEGVGQEAVATSAPHAEQTHVSVPNYDRFGYALAMRVLQSDLYHQLDDRERAECDGLIRAATKGEGK